MSTTTTLNAESLDLWTQLCDGTDEFNRPRVTRRRKDQLIENAVELRSALLRLGWHAQLIADVELGRMPRPDQPDWENRLAIW